MSFDAPAAPRPGEGGGRRVLVVGGTGTFGRHLVHGLLKETEFGAVIGARHREPAEAMAIDLAREFPSRAISSAVIDRSTASEDDLRALRIFAVVDAAGPFQQSDYRLPRAAIDAGVHYLDLADARAFVGGFASLDAEARLRGVTAVVAASSTPAISHAVLDQITQGWRIVDTVEIGISPANRTPRGLSVVSAILSYAGRPVRLFLDGRWQARPGWGLTVRRAIPGLGRRWLSLCETPDLDLVPVRFAVRRSAIFRAGMELAVLHLGLLAATLPVRLRLLRSLTPLARSFRGMADRLLRFGSDRGGMLVEAHGADAEGEPMHARWSLVADAGEGPIVPTLPALALLRKLDAGALPAGAHVSAGLLTLQEIEREFRSYRISTKTESRRGLFARAVAGFDRMPAAIREAHTTVGETVLRGEASVEGAEHWLGSSVRSLMRLPPPARHVPVSVRMQVRGESEIWTRDFGGRRFRTVLGERVGGMTERFGLLTFDLEVPCDERGLTMAVKGWRMGPIPLPKGLSPTTEAREFVDKEGRFRFDVSIALPMIGRIVRYRGWLVPG